MRHTLEAIREWIETGRYEGRLMGDADILRMIEGAVDQQDNALDDDEGIAA